MDAVELVRTELADKAFSRRASAARSLGVVAIAVGPDRCAQELVPLLIDTISEHKDEDELLCMIAGACVEMVEKDAFDARGDNGDKMGALLLPIEALCNADETLTRSRACDAIHAIVTASSAKYVAHKVFPVVKRMSEGEWFAPRCSAMICVPWLYNALATEKEIRDRDLMPIIKRLSEDETPMVVKVAARKIGLMISHDSDSVVSHVLPIIRTLTAEPRVSVRSTALSHISAVSGVLDGAGILDHVLPLIRTFAVDKSWTVRAVIAKQLATIAVDLAGKTSGTQACSALVPFAVELLADPLDEVRTYAADAITSIVEALAPEDVVAGVNLDAVLLYLSEMNARVDRTLASRMAAARTTLALAAANPTTHGLSFKSLWEEMLKDRESPNNSDVRRVLLARLDVVSLALTPEFLVGVPPEPAKARKSIRNLSRQSTAPATTDAGWGKLLREIYSSSKNCPDPDDPASVAANDGASTSDVIAPKWRVRASLIKCLDSLAGSSDAGKLFALSTWEDAIRDDAKEVRTEAIRQLTKFNADGSGMGGPSGVAAAIVPKLVSFFNGVATSNYQFRMEFCDACAVLVANPEAWVILEPLFAQTLRDKVPNVVHKALRCVRETPSLVRDKSAISDIISNSKTPPFIKAAAQAAA